MGRNKRFGKPYRDGGDVLCYGGHGMDFDAGDSRSGLGTQALRLRLDLQLLVCL